MMLLVYASRRGRLTMPPEPALRMRKVLART